MRVMVLVKATEDSENGVLPQPEMFEAMAKFNEALVEAGVSLAADGLAPSSKGKRVKFDGAARTVAVRGGGGVGGRVLALGGEGHGGPESHYA